MIDLKNWQDITEELKTKAIEFPQFNVNKVKEEGKKAPVWLHFGGGNLYRGFHAELAQNLANQQLLEAGIVVCETFDDEVVTKAYQPYHNDVLEVVMHADGQLDKRILAATADSIYCQPENDNGFKQVVSHFENPTLQFVTLTITEKGYGLKNTDGHFSTMAQADIDNGPTKAKHTIGILVALLYKRFLAGELPIAMVSTDNFSQNGKRFLNSVNILAQAWQEKNFVESAFLDYLNNPEKVSFPWSMIDRITPNPSETVQQTLEKSGWTDMSIIHTSKHTNIAPFTNTEVVHYLVIEDSFPNGRPALEKAGVILTDRKTVDKADIMKVTTCLNPLHTALAVTGCLLGYQSISAEMNDQDLVGLIKGIGYQEGLPVVENPGIIQPQAFIDEVIQQRLTNPNIPDTPQRIASDTSQKVAIRFGETIKKYQEDPNRNVQELTFIPLGIAAWLRYLLAIDDEGQPFVPSPDPLLTELQTVLQDITFGEQETEKIHTSLVPILQNSTIFGIDLVQIGLSEKIETYFKEMVVGPGAVRQTIHRYVEMGGK
ncbi:mannitol dehydrogenase family protein [Enterococcus faecalis]|uniref:mannitol dehydrogenase family protein n=1 Tax=Enterococcus faecalis TaxID=1351 RepID=UPI0001F0D16F|nr:mannitol dehydrogenase family protein [Enterococcus faecalis]EFT95505.1 mannitol dehydrogenase domain protein [Enterococcus faecalis TX0012]